MRFIVFWEPQGLHITRRCLQNKEYDWFALTLYFNARFFECVVLNDGMEVGQPDKISICFLSKPDLKNHIEVQSQSSLVNRI